MPPLRLIILHNHYRRQRIYNISNLNVDHFDGQQPSFPSTPSLILSTDLLYIVGPRLFEIHRHRSVYNIIYIIYIPIVPTPYTHTLYYRILIIIAHHNIQYTHTPCITRTLCFPK